MSMPWQLKVGLYERRKSRHREPRPIAETLPHINVNDLSIPRDYKTYIAPYISLRYPEISGIRLAFHCVEFHHSGRVQTFRFKWIKTGFGYRRPAFICECGRPVIKLYFRHLNLACRRCTNALYASQTCDKHTRPILQALRLETFLKLKSYMGQRNRRRLKARIPKTHSKRLNSKRLSHHMIQLPHSNYSTRGAMHWR